MNAPQANDIDKILDLPLAVADGVDTKPELATRYDFDERQVDYYLEAEEILGLVRREEGQSNLTEDGKKYRLLDPSQQKLMIIRKMISAPIMALVMGELVGSDKKIVSKDEIERLIEKHTDIRGTTVPRRAECMLKWFGWIGDETGVFSASADAVRLRIESRENST